jgi:hypothetical protein
MLSGSCGLQRVLESRWSDKKLMSGAKESDENPSLYTNIPSAAKAGFE